MHLNLPPGRQRLLSVNSSQPGQAEIHSEMGGAGGTKGKNEGRTETARWAE